ncbi:hypothetical protein X743_30375 [Mesorhizobium sp. LNHC252B00]|nr:hypothetical protein X743_30375 [Mesorhizobium sp. LNHC252B00]
MHSPVTSRSAGAAFLRLLLERHPRGTAGEQANQLDQARVRTAAISDTRDVKLGPVHR